MGASYDGKLYVCTGNEMDGFQTYTSDNMGKGDLVLEKKNLNIYSSKNRYMIGTTMEPTDVGPRKLCIYDAKTKKTENLGFGYCPKIIGNNVYYAHLNEKNGRYDLRYRILGTKTTKVVGELPKDEKFLIVANHLCIEDIPTLGQAVQDHIFVLVSDEDKKTLDGLALSLNGVQWVTRLDKESRKMASQNAVNILKRDNK